MNRAKFEELKAKVNNIISERDKKLAELQNVITDCYSNITANNVLMNAAEASGDPESYQRASTLVNMYRDRLRKTEEKQRALVSTPVISRADYDEVVAFIEAETGMMVNEEVAEIWDHLKAIEEIYTTCDKYGLEFRALADTCQNVNHASVIGEFKTMTVSGIPRHWLDGIMESMRFFRPKG